ncbi:MAG: hypothetical protein HKM98_06845 [Gammaproteobacteria bacterium]|nr:hypothetical protein [Gammaproteobacteria bacterium]
MRPHTQLLSAKVYLQTATAFFLFTLPLLSLAALPEPRLPHDADQAGKMSGRVGKAASQVMTGMATAGSEPVEFYIYTDPLRHSGRNPQLGINWLSESGGPSGPASPFGADNGGHIMFMSGLNTLRIGLDDCTAPAGFLPQDEWEDVTPLSHVLSLGGSLFTDPLTGRTVAAQSTGASDLVERSDDDGASWTPAATGLSSLDLSLGGGRLAEPLYSVLTDNNPLYNGFAHGVFACAGQVASTTCSVSLDGANSFGPPVPAWTLAECSVGAGRLQVSQNSGTAYLPNRSCGGAQGFAVSVDNGLTWAIKNVPASGNGSWSPSISEASDGRLYFAFDNGGAPMVTVSADGGNLWSSPFDAGVGEIRSTAFPAIIAGDGDRAAFAFLGSETVGAVGSTPGLAAEWHLYVSMTFDGGTSWTTKNITGTDPVQRGSICDDEQNCTLGANLGESIDIRMDRRGRPVIAFADGCIGACISSPQVPTYSSIASIARLKSFKGLIAAFDSERQGQPDLPLTTAYSNNEIDVELEWSEPGDGGNDITGYRVRKNGIDLLTLGPEFRRYTDTGGFSDFADYEVLAENSIGSSRIKTGCTATVVTDPSCLPDCPPPPGPCDLYGVTVMVDPAGDSDAGLGTGNGPGAYDLLRLGISESFFDFGADRVAFVLEVQSTETLPPNSVWPVRFKGADGLDRFVRMDTFNGAPAFSYGTGTQTNPGLVPGIPAEPESRVEGNLIIIAVPRSATGTEILEQMDSFLVRVAVNLVGASLTPDNMPDSLAPEGQYSVYGSENCMPDPILWANPDHAQTSACAAVAIDVLENDFSSTGVIELIGHDGASFGSVQIITQPGTDNILYTPDTGFTGNDVFSYTIGNGEGATAQGDVFVNVTASDDTDGDGVMDSCDNCINVENSNQCNTNPEQDNFGNHCDADLNNDNIVNSFDLSIMRQNFGQSGENDADLNCDNIVNSFDLSIMRQNFGGAPGPSGLADAL